MAVLREQGYPDEAIADALGVSRQAVGQRFGRKGSFTPEAAGDAGLADVPRAG